MAMFDIFNEDFDENDLFNEEPKKDDNNDDEKNKGKKKLDECNEDNEGDDDDDENNDDDKDDDEGDDDDDDEKKKGKKKDDDKDDDDDEGNDDLEDIKDEEVIDSFIINEAALDDLIALQESEKINFNKERKVRWITKEQKLKKLTYKISILMAKKSNDADYKRWAKGRAIVVAARKKIMLKYKSRALARARKVIAAYRAGKFSGLLQDKRDIAQPKGIQKT